MKRVEKIALPGKRKPWHKCSPEGRMYWDTKHPNFIKWFTQQVETLGKATALTAGQVRSATNPMEPISDRLERQPFLK